MNPFFNARSVLFALLCRSGAYPVIFFFFFHATGIVCAGYPFFFCIRERCIWDGGPRHIIAFLEFYWRAPTTPDDWFSTLLCGVVVITSFSYSELRVYAGRLLMGRIDGTSIWSLAFFPALSFSPGDNPWAEISESHCSNSATIITRHVPVNYQQT